MTTTRDLEATIVAITDLLERHGDTGLARRLRDGLDRLHRGDHAALRSLLSEATGGTGSLRDRILSPSNGDDIAPGECAEVNTRLHALVETLARQAREALEAAA